MRFGASLILCLALLGSQARGETYSKAQSMSFENCKRFTEKSVRELGVPFDAVVRTEIFWITKIPTRDGAVLISCSKPDRKMVLTRSTP